MPSLVGLRNCSVIGPVKVVVDYDGNPRETMATGAPFLLHSCTTQSSATTLRPRLTEF